MQSRQSGNSRGIDVSHYQDVIDWSVVAASGIEFAFIKSSENIDTVDSAFKRNLDGATSAGLFVGAYHFLKAGTASGGIAEADHFIKTVVDAGGFDRLDIDPVVDVEDAGNTVASARAFIDRVKTVTGRQCIVYTYPSFIDETLKTGLSDMPLWLADYSHNAPSDRGGWTSWTFIQSSDNGRVPGINGPVDLDEFNGRLHDMFDTLKTSVATAVKRIDTLETALAKTPAPAWFTAEFGSDEIATYLKDATGDTDFWRNFAVMLRVFTAKKI